MTFCSVFLKDDLCTYKKIQFKKWNKNIKIIKNNNILIEKNIHIYIGVTLFTLKNIQANNNSYIILRLNNQDKNKNNKIGKLIAIKECDPLPNNENKECIFFLSPFLYNNIINNDEMYPISNELYYRIVKSNIDFINIYNNDLYYQPLQSIQPPIATNAIIQLLNYKDFNNHLYIHNKNIDIIASNSLINYFKIPRLVKKTDIFAVPFYYYYLNYINSLDEDNGEIFSKEIDYYKSKNKIKFFFFQVEDLFNENDNENNTISMIIQFNKTSLNQKTNLDHSMQPFISKKHKCIYKNYYYLFSPSSTNTKYHYENKKNILFLNNETIKRISDLLKPILMYNKMEESEIQQFGRKKNDTFTLLLEGTTMIEIDEVLKYVVKDLGKCGVYPICWTNLYKNASSENEMMKNLKNELSVILSLGSQEPIIVYLRGFFYNDKSSGQHNGTGGSENKDSELRFLTILSEFFIEYIEKYDNNIVILASTDKTDALPFVIKSFFLYQEKLMMPTNEQRKNYLNYKYNTEPNDNLLWEKLSKISDGLSFSDLDKQIADASTHSLKIINKDKYLENNNEETVSFLFSKLFEEDIKSSHVQLDLENIKENINKTSKNKDKLSIGIPTVKWYDIGGLDQIKNEINDMIFTSQRIPRKKDKKGNLIQKKTRQGILLYGPPGTGKTLIGKAVANTNKMKFINIKGPELLNKYIGESEKNIRDIFYHAKNNRVENEKEKNMGTLLFFDEIDCLCPQRNRNSDSNNVMDRVVSQLLAEFDTLNYNNTNPVFVIGATNRPDLIDPALLRPGRFDRLLYVGPDNINELNIKNDYKILIACTRKFKLDPDVDFNEIIDFYRKKNKFSENNNNNNTIFLTGADYYGVASQAFCLAIKDKIFEINQLIDKNNISNIDKNKIQSILETMSFDDLQVVVKKKHFLKIFETVQPSVSKKELLYYDHLRNKYNSIQ